MHGTDDTVKSWKVMSQVMWHSADVFNWSRNSVEMFYSDYKITYFAGLERNCFPIQTGLSNFPGFIVVIYAENTKCEG